MGRLALLIVLATFLAACGGDGAPTPPPAVTPTGAPSATVSATPAAPTTDAAPTPPPTRTPTPSGGASLGIVATQVPSEIKVAFLTRAQVYDDTVFIDVATDLPDGAVVHYAVAEGETGQGPREHQGTLLIDGRRGIADVDVTGWEGPLVRVSIAFRPGAREQAGMIHGIFGETGQRLVGANVSTGEGGKLIQTNTVLRFPTVVEHRGRGNGVVGPFTLLPGLVTLFAQHSGQSDIQIQFQGDGGAGTVALAGAAEYLGERAYSVTPEDTNGTGLSMPPGEYRLAVTADGPWLVELVQEFPTGGFVFPIHAEDVGDEVVRWIKLTEGAYTLEASHEGEEAFLVELLNASGAASAPLIDAVGDYRGSAEIVVDPNNPEGLLPGFYALAVRADGHWNVTVAE